ncbi:RNA polymerase I-specific transcription initiation factor RRN3 [Lutzomyia longipalpis]|uniref:RNA polymerase I-specific transcription initiation factor RRN3 n=1 Tax=Lutzomyia longipalpis TaxID=7200 RepID=UPI0024846E76|nr:RNA polymerase I-specific transcription initiation factor RRN3 [Lutzomyia longipalpis]
MSIISKRTSLTSILKDHSTVSRDRARQDAHNKVRFSLTTQKSVKEIFQKANEGDFADYEEYITMMKTSALSDDAFLNTVQQSRRCIPLLRPQFAGFVETLLSLKWAQRNKEIREEFKQFILELMVMHNKYARIGVDKLLSVWIPEENAAASWPRGTPNDDMMERLSDVHEVIAKLIELIPMISSLIVRAVDALFPYFKRSPHILAGYLHNVLWLLSYQPIFTEDVLRIILSHLLKVDVNAPRSDIEDAEEDDEEMHNIFEMDDVRQWQPDEMRLQLAESLDICLTKLYEYLDRQITQSPRTAERTFRTIMNAFETVILPAHSPHHIQFFIFYCLSLRGTFAETFVKNLWDKVCNPNVAPGTRQVCVYYIASLLARAKFLPLTLIQNMLKEFCSWAHQYIARYDSSRTDATIRAHGVFFAICQAVFYVIAFRSRDLTAGKRQLILLQSLHLSAIVTSPLNPLRVCLPAVATAFAGVTRAHQLTYCHTILERNARKKLATVYMSDVEMPEETLDTFFPFDPYLLKKSSKYIENLYLKYQASEEEEKPDEDSARKRKDTIGDEDDFIAEKRLRTSSDAARSPELQFTYSFSPGFHT